MEKNNYFINVNFNRMSGLNHIFNKFDYEVIEEMYKNCDEQGIPLTYDFMYKFISLLPKNKVVVTISPDPAITASTIAGMSEKYMYGQVEGNSRNTPNLKIIYLTATPHLLGNYKEITIENFTNSIVSNLIGKSNFSFVKNKLLLNPEQFFILGINDNLLEDDQKEELDNSEISYFTMSQIRKKGIFNVMDYINEKIGNDPVMIIYDMSCASHSTAPCVTRFLREGIRTNVKDLNGFTNEELLKIFNKINTENLVGLDITSFDFRIDDKEIGYRITCESAKLALSLLRIKEKKINIFNEHSRFLIHRPIEQINEKDKGWYILRGVPLDLRESIMKKLNNDTITSLNIDIEGDGNEETVLIATTTIFEQEKFSYLNNEDKLKITDCVLFPVEKTSMMFELLNTNENSLHI